jgi:hypothetical protein
MSASKNFFTLVNNIATGVVEFHIRQGDQRFRSLPVHAGQSRQIPTGAPASAVPWYVYATWNGIPIGAAHETTNPCDRFTVSGDGWQTAVLERESPPPAAAPRRPAPRRAEASSAAHHESIVALGESKDLAAAGRIGDALLTQAGPMTAERADLIHRLCTGLRSHDFGDLSGQDQLAVGLAISTLDHAKSLPIQTVANLLMSLPDSPPPTDPAQQKEWRERRSRIAELWMAAYRRAEEEADASFNPREVPLLNVPAPEGSAFPAGAASELESPQHGAAYREALAENARKAEEYEKQIALRELRDPLWAGMMRHLALSYTPGAPDRAELSAHADRHLERDHKAKILKVIQSASSTLVEPSSAVLPTSVVARAHDRVAGRAPGVFGVGEIVDLEVRFAPNTPVPALHWVILSGPGTLRRNPEDGDASFVAGDVHGGVNGDETVLSLRLRDAPARKPLYTLRIRTVPPNYAYMTQYPGSQVRHTSGAWSAGFLGQITLLNTEHNVSFSGVRFSEGTVLATASSFLARWNHLPHPVGSGHTVGMGNIVNAVDTVFSGELGPPFADGDFAWPIPWRYKVGTGAWRAFFTANHHSASDQDGTALIEKAGAGPFITFADDPTSDYFDEGGAPGTTTSYEAGVGAASARAAAGAGAASAGAGRVEVPSPPVRLPTPRPAPAPAPPPPPRPAPPPRQGRI